jgi:uncharacterized protein (DUF2252 family)
MARTKRHPKIEHPDLARRTETGKQARKVRPRSSLAEVPELDRDPVALIEAQETTRLPELLPERHGRMATSAFAFYRGTAAIMAHDLRRLPTSGLEVQLCGDAHVSNFGIFATPERHQIFDLNDFDETAPGPFEWDVQRLAASCVLAVRDRGWGEDFERLVTQAGLRSYRESMHELAGLGELGSWYSKIEPSEIGPMLPPDRRQLFDERVAKAFDRNSKQAADKLTEVVDGARRFRDDPPLLMHRSEIESVDVHEILASYRDTLPKERRALVERFRVVDVALKVVGVGSVGTRCFVVLMEGRDDDDLLMLQVKEATRSVLEPVDGPSAYEHQGERVVLGQRIMQAASDIFLGWVTGPVGNQFYWRQLRDSKMSVDLNAVRRPGMKVMAEVCGRALARAHARGGDRVAIASYLGTGTTFDDAMTEFALGYAAVAEQDYAQMLDAIGSGRLERTETAGPTMELGSTRVP